MTARRLKFIELDEARQLSFEAVKRFGESEQVHSTQAVGRVLAEDVRCEIAIPPHSIAFYDGYALRANDTSGCSDGHQVKLRLAGRLKPGDSSVAVSLGLREAAYVAGGAPLPAQADAVLRVEQAIESDGEIVVSRKVDPHENVVFEGEDIVPGAVALHKRHVVRPQDVGILLEAEIAKVMVLKEPRVSVFTVGDEIEAKLRKNPSCFADNYCVLLRSFLEHLGVKTLHLGCVSDNVELIERKIIEGASSSDVVLMIGGCSVGENDLAPDALQELGPISFHGVRLTPGKVSGLGIVSGKPVFMVPGHVGSAVSCCCLFVIPAISNAYFSRPDPFLRVIAKLAADAEGRPGLCSFKTVKVSSGKDGYVAYPLEKRMGGSTLLTSVTEAEGFTLVPPGCVLKKGDLVDVSLFSWLEVFSIETQDMSTTKQHPEAGKIGSDAPVEAIPVVKKLADA